jgi:transposase
MILFRLDVEGAGMRGSDARSGSLFSYVDLEQRVPAKHPLRVIKGLVDDVLTSLDGEFERLYEGTGRQSVAPERLLRASLLQAFYSVRSERQLMEQIDYNLLFRWFVGLGIDDPVWDHSTFSKNRRAVRGTIHCVAGTCPTNPARTGYFLVVETQKEAGHAILQ